ncbi:MAG: type III-A CRISPR-associated RAMP protein Csm5 [Methanosarcinales archaeon]
MKLILDTVTPIHIGSGVEVDPFEYVIDDKFYKINLNKFIELLDEKDRNNFLDISAKNIVQTRQVIKNKANLYLVSEYTAKVSDEVRNIYNSKISDPRNELDIQTFIKSRNLSYVPGSSVKGAIRTALLYYYANKPLQRADRNIEGEVFRYKNAGNDPFRALKISDSGFIRHEQMQVYNVKTYTKKFGQFRSESDYEYRELGFNIFMECTDAHLLNKKVRLEHTLHIDEELQKYNYLKIKLTPEIIIKACKEFYGKLIESEKKFFEGESAESIYLELEKLDGLIEKKDNMFLLRLGGGSQYDGITLNLAMQRREVKKSRKLINSKYPLGWVLATVT